MWQTVTVCNVQLAWKWRKKCTGSGRFKTAHKMRSVYFPWPLMMTDTLKPGAHNNDIRWSSKHARCGTLRLVERETPSQHASNRQRPAGSVSIYTHQGSNSWMILSNRMTANNRELKPATHANASTKKTMRLFQPPGFDSAVRISPFPPASAIFALSLNQTRFDRRSNQHEGK